MIRHVLSILHALHFYLYNLFSGLIKMLIKYTHLENVTDKKKIFVISLLIKILLFHGLIPSIDFVFKIFFIGTNLSIKLL